MTEWHRWDDVRAELSDALGSTEEQDQRREQLRREVALQRLVEMRKRAGLTQTDVAERMGVSKARISHIEHGAVATIDLLARYLDAIGGRLEITAAFDGGAQRSSWTGPQPDRRNSGSEIIVTHSIGPEVVYGQGIACGADLAARRVSSQRVGVLRGHHGRCDVEIGSPRPRPPRWAGQGSKRGACAGAAAGLGFLPFLSCRPCATSCA